MIQPANSRPAVGVTSPAPSRLDGSTGEVFLGELPVVPSPVVLYLEEGLDVALADVAEGTADVIRAVDRLLAHADRVRRMRVRANADTGVDADRARRMGPSKANSTSNNTAAAPSPGSAPASPNASSR
jgi:hypothetical protein